MVGKCQVVQGFDLERPTRSDPFHRELGRDVWSMGRGRW
jgi:hypothetical protein